MKYIINKNAIVVFYNNKPVRIEKTDSRYANIIAAFDLEGEEQEQALIAALETKSINPIDINTVEGFALKDDGSVWYGKEKLPAVLAEKVQSIADDGLPLDNFEKFWANLRLNPSSQSVLELYDFLAYKELPITEDGCFIAYKGVNEEYWSIHGNTETQVLRGQVDVNGRIYNGVGEEIEVLRRDVNDDRNVHCSWGLHVGSLDYASSFASHIVIVKVNPKDVVSVPTDHSCQKCRVCAYTVVDDFESEIKDSVVDENGQGASVKAIKELNEFTKRVARYLDSKEEAGYDVISIRQIQNSFSPEYPSKEKVLNALQELEYFFFTGEDGATYVDLW